jgi:5-methylcytosine-specific restriction enzyme subunit McrC
VSTTINISALDCLPFKEEEASGDVIAHFIKTCQNAVFWFNPFFEKDQDESPLAEYDYKQHQWRAGRFIGEANFDFQGQNYHITIKPRFGEDVLLKMLEQIFNIRISPSQTKSQNDSDWQHFIKRLIAIIWVQHLANANLHGLPRKTVKRQYQGIQVRGRIDVRKSSQPLKTKSELVSHSFEKAIDSDIISIVHEAYHILKTDFDLGSSQLNLPDSAQTALNQIFEAKIPRKHISYRQYQQVKYKAIYRSWKPLVDFSWDIISQKQQGLKQDQKSKGFGFFLDMAEIWEQYLRSILQKNLLPLGWNLKKTTSVAYDGYFFKRQLIPDLVFENENQAIIWDAKYKRMQAHYKDVDRSDFFQIHTYLLSYTHKDIKIGGLLYPFTINEGYQEDKFRSPYLLSPEGLNTSFGIDGIELKHEMDTEDFHKKELEFLNRIKQDIA